MSLRPYTEYNVRLKPRGTRGGVRLGLELDALRRATKLDKGASDSEEDSSSERCSSRCLTIRLGELEGAVADARVVSGLLSRLRVAVE